MIVIFRIMHSASFDCWPCHNLVHNFWLVFIIMLTIIILKIFTAMTILKYKYFLPNLPNF